MRGFLVVLLAMNFARVCAEDIETLSKAADHGDPEATYKLGEIYQDRKLFSEAAQRFQRAAAAGNRKAQLGLGRLHAEKKITDANENDALKWLLLAAEELPEAIPEATKVQKALTTADVAKAHFALYEFYTSGIYYPRKAQPRALAWLHKSAEGGYAKAQGVLGRAYAIGHKELPKDDDRALIWTRKAAEQGDLNGISDLQMRYRFGRGVPKDEAEVLKLTRKAADLGSSYKQYELGSFYEKGKGVEPNPAEAVKWYRLAADQGEIYAMNGLGRCLLCGTGVAKDKVEADKVEAAKWMDIAVRIMKSKPHQPFLDIILKQLSDEETARAHKLADEWRPKSSRAEEALSSPVAEKKNVVKDSPDLRDAVIVIPMALSRDGRGMATVTQCNNPDPLAKINGHGLVDAIEIWNTITMTKLSRSGAIAGSHMPGMAHVGGQLSGPFLFSPDGRQLLVGSEGEGVSILRVATLEGVGTLSRPKIYITGRLGVPCAAFTSKGDMIYTAYGPVGDRKLKGGQVWNTTDRTVVREFALEGISTGISLSPDEKLILTAGNGVRLWDASSGRQLAEFHPHAGRLEAAAFHPSGRFVAFAGEGGAGVLEVIRDGDKIRLDHFLAAKFAGIPLGATGIRSVAYSPDGRYLGIADARDHVLRIMEAESGKPIGSVPQLGRGPVLFTPDSKAVWLAGPQAPVRFEITRMTEQSFRDTHAMIAAGNLLYWAHVKLARKAGTLKWEPPFMSGSLYDPELAKSQAIGILAPGYAEATSIVAKLIDLPDPEIQMLGVFALAAIGEEILKKDPSLGERLKAKTDPEFARRAMPWLQTK